MLDLVGLFLAAFAAATVLPAQSEAVLVALLLNSNHSTLLLLAVATAGNVLGAVLNWVMGRFLDHFSDRSWFPVSRSTLGKAQFWYGRWGWWSLFGSWIPLVGDPITLAAGVMREPIWRFILIVTLAKGGRYLALAAAVQGLF